MNPKYKVKRSKKDSKKPKISGPLKLAIARAVRTPKEVKFITSWNGQQATSDVYGNFYNAGMNGPTNVAILPQITQSTNVGGRIGNKITPTRLTVDFWVNLANTQSSAEIAAKLVILESKNIRDNAQVTTASLATLLDNGQSQGPFVGYPSNLSVGINTDEFKVHMNRILLLSKGAGMGPDFINSFVGDQQTQATPSSGITHFQVTLKTPAVLSYQTAGSVWPDGFAPFFNCGYAICANQSPDIPDINIARLQVMFKTTLYYTDA